MRAGGYNLGGEQSGHVVFLDHNTTGDGLISALQALAIVRRTGRPLSELVAGFQRFPQLLLNVRVSGKRPFEEVPAVLEAVRKIEQELGSRGRVLLRYSGTEPLARVMVEGEDEDRVQVMAEDLAEVVRRNLGTP
jgi:phosphoglucosamine mutase